MAAKESTISGFDCRNMHIIAERFLYGKAPNPLVGGPAGDFSVIAASPGLGRLETAVMMRIAAQTSPGKGVRNLSPDLVGMASFPAIREHWPGPICVIYRRSRHPDLQLDGSIRGHYYEAEIILLPQEISAALAWISVARYLRAGELYLWPEHDVTSNTMASLRLPRPREEDLRQYAKGAHQGLVDEDVLAELIYRSNVTDKVRIFADQLCLEKRLAIVAATIAGVPEDCWQHFSFALLVSDSKSCRARVQLLLSRQPAGEGVQVLADNGSLRERAIENSYCRRFSEIFFDEGVSHALKWKGTLPWDLLSRRTDRLDRMGSLIDTLLDRQDGEVGRAIDYLFLDEGEDFSLAIWGLASLLSTTRPRDVFGYVSAGLERCRLTLPILEEALVEVESGRDFSRTLHVLRALRKRQDGIVSESEVQAISEETGSSGFSCAMVFLLVDAGCLKEAPGEMLQCLVKFARSDRDSATLRILAKILLLASSPDRLGTELLDEVEKLALETHNGTLAASVLLVLWQVNRQDLTLKDGFEFMQEEATWLPILRWPADTNHLRLDFKLLLEAELGDSVSARELAEHILVDLEEGARETSGSRKLGEQCLSLAELLLRQTDSDSELLSRLFDILGIELAHNSRATGKNAYVLLKSRKEQLSVLRARVIHRILTSCEPGHVPEDPHTGVIQLFEVYGQALWGNIFLGSSEIGPEELEDVIARVCQLTGFTFKGLKRTIKGILRQERWTQMKEWGPESRTLRRDHKRTLTFYRAAKRCVSNRRQDVPLW